MKTKYFTAFLYCPAVAFLIMHARPISSASRVSRATTIVGGQNAKTGDYKYQISLDLFGSSICGGGIVDSRHIVTAAHCVTDKKGKITSFPYRVVAGTVDLNRNSATRVSIPVAKIFVPKKYNPANNRRTIADIAVLKLVNALPLGSNPNLSRLTLPKDNRQTFAGKTATITGFGLNSVDVVTNPKTGEQEEVNGKSFNKMRHASVRVISTPSCQRFYSDPLSPSHLCGSVVQHNPRRPEGICSGDSGGPLVYRNILIGTVSTSPTGCREDRVPAVYTRVSSWLNFLRKAIRDQPNSNALTKTLFIR